MLLQIRLSVVCLSSVTCVHPTQGVYLFGDIFAPYCSLTIWQLTHQKSGRSSNESVKCNGGKKKLQFPTNISLYIARKRLKIDEYMLRFVWPALNPISIHVTFTAIVPGAYTYGRPKCVKQANLAYRQYYLFTICSYLYAAGDNK